MSPGNTVNKRISISKEQLAALPAAHFEGEICVIEKIDDVEEAVSELLQSDIIGFDTETRPTFRKGQTNTVSLLQLSTRQKSFLFRLNRIGLPDRILSLLEDSRCLMIGLSIHDDFHNLSKIAKIKPDGFIDLQNYVKQFNIADNSLSRIYGIVFGERISKGQRLTNWEADALTPAQQSYAALDAMACIRIYDYLSSGKFDPDQSPYLVDIPPSE